MTTETSIRLRSRFAWRPPAESAFAPKRRQAQWLVHLGAAVLIGWVAPLQAQTVDLGTAENFTVLGASAVSNTGPSVVTGDLGISPGEASSVTGFPPGIIDGDTHFGDAVALQAQDDVTTAYVELAGRACDEVISADLAGMTLTPGVYCAATSMGLTGTLTLDAQGNAAAEFIFQMGSTLTTGSASAVEVINSADACNVYWQVGSSATLGTGTDFVGNILALESITLNTDASLSGRTLARTAAVTLDSNAVTRCDLQQGVFPPPPPPPLPEPRAVPTLSQWSLLALTSLVLLVGVLGVRRFMR
jgi:hypothetical protein